MINLHLWFNVYPHMNSTMEANFQYRFSANICQNVTDCQLTGPFFLVGQLTDSVFMEFLEHELPGL
jgi:hypothetical protein